MNYQQEENLGLMKTRPLLMALEYSEIFVALLLNVTFLSSSTYVISYSVWPWLILFVVLFISSLKFSPLYCWVHGPYIDECFLAVTSNVSGSKESMIGLVVWLFLSTCIDLSVSLWVSAYVVRNSSEEVYLFSTNSKNKIVNLM